MKKEEKIDERKDFLYAKEEKDFLKFYREILNILSSDFNFDNVKETSHTEYIPKKPKLSATIVATKEKDPRTKIEITIKFGYKKPPEKEKTSEDLLMVSLKYKGAVITEYKKETRFERSVFYEFLINLLEKTFYKKERKKYVRECKKLLNEVIDKIRKLYEELPYVGKVRE